MRIFRKFRLLVLMSLISLVLGFGKTALADDIILNNLNGQAVNLSHSEGKPVIFLFWTTWCSYCRKELKVLNQLYPQLEKEGITLFAVNIGEPDYRVIKFVKDYALIFNVLLDKTGGMADQFNVIGVPTYVLLNKSGERVVQDNELPKDYKNLLFR